MKFLKILEENFGGFNKILQFKYLLKTSTTIYKRIAAMVNLCCLLTTQSKFHFQVWGWHVGIGMPKGLGREANYLILLLETAHSDSVKCTFLNSYCNTCNKSGLQPIVSKKQSATVQKNEKCTNKKNKALSY